MAEVESKRVFRLSSYYWSRCEFRIVVVPLSSSSHVVVVFFFFFFRDGRFRPSSPTQSMKIKSCQVVRRVFVTHYSKSWWLRPANQIDHIWTKNKIVPISIWIPRRNWVEFWSKCGLSISTYINKNLLRYQRRWMNLKPIKIKCRISLQKENRICTIVLLFLSSYSILDWPTHLRSISDGQICNTLTTKKKKEAIRSITDLSIQNWQSPKIYFSLCMHHLAAKTMSEYQCHITNL